MCGVVDGISRAFIVTMTTVAPDKFAKTPLPADIKEISDKLFVRYTRDQIRDVITDLYKDPANAFIDTLDMFFLARDKIEGKDIGKGLMDEKKGDGNATIAALADQKLEDTKAGGDHTS